MFEKKQRDSRTRDRGEDVCYQCCSVVGEGCVCGGVDTKCVVLSSKGRRSPSSSSFGVSVGGVVVVVVVVVSVCSASIALLLLLS